MRMWAASAGVLASAMARSKAIARLVVAAELQQEARRCTPRNGNSSTAAAPAARSSPSAACGPAHLGHRDRAVERHHRRRLHASPARRRAGRSAPSRCPRAVRRGHAAPRSRPGPDRARCGDGASPCRSAPAPRRSACRFHRRAVLVVEQDDRAIGVEPRRGAGVLQQQQRGQPHDLGLGSGTAAAAAAPAGSPPRTAARADLGGVAARPNSPR